MQGEENKIGKRLKEIMHSENVRVKALAKETGLAEGTIRDIMSGSNDPSAYTLTQLCKALNVSADYLLGIEGKCYFCKYRSYALAVSNLNTILMEGIKK